MGLFDGTSTPSWLSPAEYSLKSAQAAESIGRTFSSAFNAAASRAQNTEKLKAESANELQIVEKSAAVMKQFEGVTSSTEAFDLISKNPMWLVDPDTAPVIKRLTGFYAQKSSAELNSLEGKTRLSDLTMFKKRLAGLGSPEDRAGIEGMSDDPNTKMPSQEKWQALRLAEERQIVEQQNRIAQEQADAEAAGQSLTSTTISPKGGVTKHFSNRGQTVEQQPMQVQVLEYNGNKVPIIVGSHGRWEPFPIDKQKEITTNQRLEISKHIQSLKLLKQPGNESEIEYWENLLKSKATNPTSDPKSRSGDPLNLFGP